MEINIATLQFGFLFLLFGITLYGDSAASKNQILATHPGSISMQTGKPQTRHAGSQTELTLTPEPEDLPEGLWYKHSGKENYYVLQTAVLPAKTTVDIAVKVTQGKVKVFGGPNDEPRKRFEQEHTISEGLEKKMRLTAFNSSRIYIGIERVTKGAICQINYKSAGTIIPRGFNVTYPL